MSINTRQYFAAAILSVLICGGCSTSVGPENHSGWPAYAGSKDGNRYSSNDQINTGNVKNLKQVWSFSSHDKDTANRSQIQCNPIVIGGILYGISPTTKLFALDASTGKQHWLFDPATEEPGAAKDPNAFFRVSRGLIFWRDSKGEKGRLLYGSGSRIYAIEPSTGQPIRDFGSSGHIDLATMSGRDSGTYNPYVSVNTPGVVFGNLLISGMRVSESADAAPGALRAFNILTGKIAWTFNTIPHPGEPGYESWTDKDAWKKLGGANSWAGMALDEKRGMVYIPTGSVSGDFYGGIRKGTNLYGNSIVALDAATGKYKWHYQVIHHDLWDRDLAANPNLITVMHNGKRRDAVAQITKHGYIFILDRETGEPLHGITEMPVPPSDLPGEEAWPTQPVPTLPEPFARQHFDSNDIADLSAETHQEMLGRYRKVKHRHMFSPPSKDGSWIFPGFDGGGEWGGAAVDLESSVLYVNSSEIPWILNMIDVPKKKSDISLSAIGTNVYNKYCLSCHGADRKGVGSSYPSLLNLKNKYNAEQVKVIIENGKNMMPSFRQIPGSEKDALVSFLLELQSKEAEGPAKARELLSEKKPTILDEVPYTMTGYNRFYDSKGYPGITPPWGTLNAVDLHTGKLLWKVPLGEYEELTKKGIPVTGTENYGGPVVTKGGLIFIAATKDNKIRAFNKYTGEVLWQASLPAAGYATPATYMIGGKQYVVIACGGGKIGSKSGDEYVAFAL